MDTKSKDGKYIAGTYARFDLAAERGEGVLIYGEDGKRYIDLGSGIGVNSFGAADPIWLAAVTAQLGKLQHMSNLYYTKPQVELAELLCQKTGFEKVFFTNSGAEANECALKCARKYSFDKYGKGRGTVVTLTNSFHGRTMATLAATGQESMHNYFFPFPDGFVHVPANDLAAMEKAVDDGTVCAVMLELVQGEGGVLPLDKDYVTAAEKLCKERDVLLVIDEVQTGNGRTGSLYAYMAYGISPDIVTTAKGLSGGLPFGAAMFGAKTADTLTAGTHGTTFGGNPVAAAGALSVLRRLDDALMAEVSNKGEYIRVELEGAQGITGVTGMGLMLGIGVTRPAKDIVSDCLKAGVIVLTAKEKIRLLPPLNIEMERLEEAVEILREVISHGAV